MKLLVIEDEPELATIVKKCLEQQSYAVDIAEDGEKGSYLGRVNEYDLIILDYMLPKKLAPQVCNEIRKAGKMTPILILTVRSDAKDKVELLDGGADDYLTKPYSFEELTARIKALLRRPKHMELTHFTLEGLSLDRNRQTAMRREKEIYLTRKEYALLEYLMRHKGSVVSRGMIMEHVWNSEGDPFSNTIEAHILNLRKKVDTEKACKLIHNVPGRGYIMEARKA